jgi:hypothetical protein
MNENWWKVHPRYLAWLDKRCQLIGGELLIPSTLKSYPTPYAGVIRSLHESLVPVKIGLTVSTFYPDPHTESVSVDGYVESANTTDSWAVARAATSGNASDTAVTDWLGTRYEGGGYFERAFYLFDTSAIGDSDTIDSGTLSLYWDTNKINGDNDGQDYLSIVSTTPASNTALASGDFDQIGTTKGSSDIDISSLSGGGYKDFTLNATGLGWVTATGVSKFGMREGHDIENAPIASSQVNIAIFYFADQPDITNDPKLTITHTSTGSTNVSHRYGRLTLLGVG